MLSLIHYLDNQFFDLDLFLRAKWLTDFFLGFTMLGKTYIVAGVTVITASLLLKYKKYSYIVPLLISVGGSAISVYILKHLVARSRPVFMSIYLEDSYSFPSGHATLAVALYGFLLFYSVKNISNKIWRSVAVSSFSLLIVLLAYSRVYLGVHYFSDVVGGLLVGGIWLALSIFLFKHQLPFLHTFFERKKDKN